jgi:hypothetical protein
MEKSAHPGEGVDRPPPFPISSITYKVVMYAPAERTGTFPPFLIYSYVYSVVMPVYVKTLKLAHEEPLRSGQEVKERLNIKVYGSK